VSDFPKGKAGAELAQGGQTGKMIFTVQIFLSFLPRLSQARHKTVETPSFLKSVVWCRLNEIQKEIF
jgi:hypothetical protein